MASSISEDIFRISGTKQPTELQLGTVKKSCKAHQNAKFCDVIKSARGLISHQFQKLYVISPELKTRLSYNLVQRYVVERSSNAKYARLYLRNNTTD